jgi:hypothetical protein
LCKDDAWYGSGGGGLSLADTDGVTRGGAGVVRGGREGLVEAAGTGLVDVDTAGGGGFLIDVFAVGPRGLGFVGGADLFMDVELFGGNGFPGELLRVRILANFSASSFVTSS